MEKFTQESLDNFPFTIKEGSLVSSGSNVYQITRILRYRKFGQVAECRNVRTGEILALKIIKNKVFSQNRREAKVFNQLKNLNLHESNIVNFSECFSFKDRTCFAYEKLENNLLELVLAADYTPFHLSEIRGIAYQMLVAISALSNSGFTHGNIKPEHIMCTDGISGQFGVKLIGFSHSAKTSELCDLQIPLTCGYTAPEAFLDCPLDESLDMWSLGFTLAFLFLGQHMGPVDCEYQYMRFICDVLGQPETDILDKGCQTSRFFNRGSDGVYRLKTPQEFEETTGSEISRTHHNNLTSLDDLINQNQLEPMDYIDTKAFIDLLKSMLQVDPAHRIKPVDALNHPFITMKHLCLTPNELYVAQSQSIMEGCQYTKQQNINASFSTTNSDRGLKPHLEKENPSNVVRTKTQTETNRQRKTKGERNTMAHANSRTILSNDEYFTELLSGEKYEEGTSDKTLSENLCLDNLPLDIVTDREIDDSNIEYIDSTDTGYIPSKLIPGITITGNSNNYIVEEILSIGSYGEVARCRIEGSNKSVALKVMSQLDSNVFFNEVKTLQLLNELTQICPYFVKLNDSFSYQDCLYQEWELLDQSLFDYLRNKNVPFRVSEVRAIAQQMLVALSALKHFGITHTDIGPENIKFVNHKEQPFRVKLTDFGLACETKCLSQEDVLQRLAFRAPEIMLGLSQDEAIDTWGLGCLLSSLFLDGVLFPAENEYDHMRMIVKFLGQPDKTLLDKGTLVSDYFIKVKKGSKRFWRLKTLEQYQKKKGEVSERADPAYDDLTSLEDLFYSQNTNNSTENDDINVFLDFVKRLLAVNPAERILPVDALKHPFITMKHLKDASDKSYVRDAHRIMKNAQPREVPLDGERKITKRPVPSQTPSVHIDLTEKNTDDVYEMNATRSKGTRECTKENKTVSCKEEIINPSSSVQTKTTTGTSSLQQRTKTKGERKNVPQPDPRKIPSNDEDFNNFVSAEKCDDATSEKLDLDNLPVDKATDWETDDSDVKHIDSTDNRHSKFIPGMTITGNSNIYVVEKVLGSGSYGAVARCRIAGTNKVVALKIMDVKDESEFSNEVEILENLNTLTNFSNYFIKLNDSFVYENFLCQELELLDQTLFDFFVHSDDSITLSEIRAVAQQMLVALSALKVFGITHTDIKPDNIMFVNHKEHPFRVKLIDFGLACETKYLPQKDIFQTLAFRAPEIMLGLPRDEAIDTWSLGCLLSSLFLEILLFPAENEYDHMRMIVKLLGQPDKTLLDKGTLVSDYFRKVHKGSEHSWRFKTLEQYQKKKGEVSERADPAYDKIPSFDDLFLCTTNNSTENEDRKVFLDFVKRLLAVDPAERILPIDALKHPFITMEHLDDAADKSYVRDAHIIMTNVQPRKVPPEGERQIIKHPVPRPTPSVHIDLGEFSTKLKLHESACAANFNSEEFVRNYLNDCRGGQVTGKNTDDVNTTQSKGTRECTKENQTVSGKEEIRNPSSLVQTERKRTSSRTGKKKRKETSSKFSQECGEGNQTVSSCKEEIRNPSRLVGKEKESKKPSGGVDLNDFGKKLKICESDANFNSKEFMENYLKDQKEIKHTDVKKKSSFSKIKNFLLKKLH